MRRLFERVRARLRGWRAQRDARRLEGILGSGDEAIQRELERLGRRGDERTALWQALLSASLGRASVDRLLEMESEAVASEPLPEAEDLARHLDRIGWETWSARLVGTLIERLHAGRQQPEGADAAFEVFCRFREQSRELVLAAFPVILDQARRRSLGIHAAFAYVEYLACSGLLSRVSSPTPEEQVVLEALRRAAHPDRQAADQINRTIHAVLGFPWASANLAQVLSGEGRYEEARRQFERARTGTPGATGPDARWPQALEHGRVCLMLGRYAEALELIEEAVSAGVPGAPELFAVARAQNALTGVRSARGGRAHLETELSRLATEIRAAASSKPAYLELSLETLVSLEHRLRGPRAAVGEIMRWTPTASQGVALGDSIYQVLSDLGAPAPSAPQPRDGGIVPIGRWLLRSGRVCDFLDLVRGSDLELVGLGAPDHEQALLWADHLVRVGRAGDVQDSIARGATYASSSYALEVQARCNLALGLERPVLDLIERPEALLLPLPTRELLAAQAHAALGDWRSCVEHLTTAMEIAPRSAEVWASAGFDYLCVGLDDEAVECFERAHELDGANAYPLLGLVMSGRGQAVHLLHLRRHMRGWERLRSPLELRLRRAGRSSAEDPLADGERDPEQDCGEEPGYRGVAVSRG